MTRLLCCSTALLFACTGGTPTSDAGDDGPPLQGNPPEVVLDETAIPQDTDPPEQDGAPRININQDIPNILDIAWNTSLDGTMWLEFVWGDEAPADDSDWRRTPPRELQAGEHSEPLLGLPYAQDVLVRLVIEHEGGTQRSDAVAATSGSQPSWGPNDAELHLHDPDGVDPDHDYVVVSLMKTAGDLRTPVVILDREARIVWASRTDAFRTSMHPHPSLDGKSLMVDQNAYWSVFDATASQIIRTTLLGRELERIDSPGLHHSFTQLPDGTFGWMGRPNSGFSAYYGDDRLYRSWPDGTVTQLWSCQDWLDTLPPFEEGPYGNCGSNTTRYQPETNTFLVSMYATETVVELDAITGEPQRWFGHLPGSYAFDPPESEFWWQHGAHFTEDGELIVSTKAVDGGPNGGTNETLVRLYSIDDKAQVLTNTTTFGVGGGVYSPEMGEAMWLPNGNMHHNYGGTPRLREFAANGDLVWDVSWGSGFEVGRSTPLTWEQLYDLARLGR